MLLTPDAHAMLSILRWLQAYMAIVKAHRLLDRKGWNDVQVMLEREHPPKYIQFSTKNQHKRISQIEQVLKSVRKWQLRKTTCLPWSIAAYRLLMAVDAEPVLKIGVQGGGQVLGHAWVEIDGRAFADDDMTAEERCEFRVIVQVPEATQKHQ